MKRIAKWLLILGLVMIVFTCLPICANAQIIDPNCDPLDPKCPIDGGLGVLLATGIAYGIKKVRGSGRKEITKTQD